MAKERVFGWIQDASNLQSLTAVVRSLIPGNEQYDETLRRICRYVVDPVLRDQMVTALVSGGPYPYGLLKGAGAGPRYQLTAEQNSELFGLAEEEAEQLALRGGRGNAACSGITQVSLTAQDGRPYQSDWAAESYLRLGVTLGLLSWDAETDLCTVTDVGAALAQGDEAETCRIMRAALLSYPPVLRIMELLAEGAKTKFELGGKLGFAEAGFTSVDQGLFLACCIGSLTAAERMSVKSSLEGTSDKYARMLCSLLQQVGLVNSRQEAVTENYGGRSYTLTMTRYELTAWGVKSLRDSKGRSSHKRSPKRVPYGMLATKAPDHAFLRFRRGNLIHSLAGKNRSVEQMLAQLKAVGVEADAATVRDDLEGFRRIGLEVLCRDDRYTIADEICGLRVPEGAVSKPEITEIRDRVRAKLEKVDHHYLQLIDLGVSGGTKGKDRDYEIVTAELLVREFGFFGMHLGGANRPDGIAACGKNGLIIDNKAYANGFAITAHQKDEMVRYIEDNQLRDPVRMPNRWWERFPKQTDTFFFLYVSSGFNGEYEKALENISYRTGITGAAVTSETLLLLAEEIKSGRMRPEDFFKLFQNKLITI